VIHAALTALVLLVCAAIYFAPLLIDDVRRRLGMTKRGKKGKGC
jgi:hypothetical protein